MLTIYLSQRVTEGKIEGMIELTERREWRRKQLLDDLDKREDIGNWKKKPWIVFCIAFALEETIELS